MSGGQAVFKCQFNNAKTENSREYSLASVSSLVPASKLGHNCRFCLVSLVTGRSFLQRGVPRPRHLMVHRWIKHQQGIFGSGSEHKLSFCSGLLAFYLTFTFFKISLILYLQHLVCLCTILVYDFLWSIYEIK